jgi:Flp pilus assembly protein TadG
MMCSSTGDAVLSSILTLTRRFGCDQRGTMLLETALVAPLLLALSAGCFEFANLFEKKLLIEAGLRDAARYAARCKQSFSGINCATVAANLAATATANGSGAARVTGWTAGAVTVQPTYLTIPITVDGSGNQNYRSSDASIYTVRVSTSFVYTGTSLLAYIGIGPITLTGAHEERYIGW